MSRFAAIHEADGKWTLTYDDPESDTHPTVVGQGKSLDEAIKQMTPYEQMVEQEIMELHDAIMTSDMEPQVDEPKAEPLTLSDM